jgi:hypothetical protein
VIELRTPGGTVVGSAEDEKGMYGILRQRKRALREFPGTFEPIEVYDDGQFKATFHVASRFINQVC